VQTIDGRPVYAATDLVAYLACEHLTQLERASLAGLVKRPMRDDPELDVIRRRGFQHEHRFLADLEAEGRRIVTVELDGSIEDRGDQLRAAAAATREAMASGPDVIYQATFFDGTWRGSGQRRQLDLNAAPVKGHSTLYTSAWGPTTPAESGVAADVIQTIPPATPTRTAAHGTAPCGQRRATPTCTSPTGCITA